MFVFQVVEIYFRHINGSFITVEGLDENRYVSVGLGEESNVVLTDGQTQRRKRRETEPEVTSNLGQSSIRSRQHTKRVKRDTFIEAQQQETTFKPLEMLSAKLDTSEVAGIHSGVAMTIEFKAFALPWENETAANAPRPVYSVYVGQDYVPHKFRFDYSLNKSYQAGRDREDEIIFISDQ